MSVSFHFEPIIPKKPITNVTRAKVEHALSSFGLATVARIADYPVQKPWVAPHVGPRGGKRGYRRTGTLGRAWTKQGPRMEGSALVCQVGNKTEYAPFVQGFTNREPRQVRWAKPYGWQSIGEVGEDEWRKHRQNVLRALEGD